jgi:hypothetical protein
MLTSQTHPEQAAELLKQNPNLVNKLPYSLAVIKGKLFRIPQSLRGTD